MARKKKTYDARRVCCHTMIKDDNLLQGADYETCTQGKEAEINAKLPFVCGLPVIHQKLPTPGGHTAYHTLINGVSLGYKPLGQA